MKPEDLIRGHLASADRPAGGTFGILTAASMVVPSGAVDSDERLGSLLLIRRPDPLAEHPEAVWAWFRLMSLLAEEPALSAKQLARRLNLGHAVPKLTRVLEALAAQGDLIAQSGGATRYRAKPWSRVLPHHMTVARERFSALVEAFDYAALAYQEVPRALQWRTLSEALVAWVKAMPNWPDVVVEDAATQPAEWLTRLAEVVPPSYSVDDDVVATLRLENARLKERNATLEAQAPQGPARPMDGGKKGELKARVAALEAENAALSARVADLEARLARRAASPDEAAWEVFLDGQGRGLLPADLPESEVDRLRALVQRTEADWPTRLALSAALGDVYRSPTSTTRLSSKGFSGHAYDSLWRRRVGDYRVVYGLNGTRPVIEAIEHRGKVYGKVVRQLG